MFVCLLTCLLACMHTLFVCLFNCSVVDLLLKVGDEYERFQIPMTASCQLVIYFFY